LRWIGQDEHRQQQGYSQPNLFLEHVLSLPRAHLFAPSVCVTQRRITGIQEGELAKKAGRWIFRA
jgi:hypothetical protein